MDSTTAKETKMTRKASPYYILIITILVAFFIMLFLMISPLLADRGETNGDGNISGSGGIGEDWEPGYVGGMGCMMLIFNGLIVDVDSYGSVVMVELDDALNCESLIERKNFVDENIVQVILGNIYSHHLRDIIVVGNRIQYMAFYDAPNDVYSFDIFIDFSDIIDEGE